MSILSRVALRWLCAYLVLTLFPIPIGYLPGTFALSGWYLRGASGIADWTQVHVFGLAKPLSLRFTGSGDTMAHYAMQFNLLVLSFVGALAWTLADRRRATSPRVLEWVRFYIRMCLATIMLGYGFSKILGEQFPMPSLERYVQPLGEFSPMGLLWTFMGYSPSYNVFTGLAEVAGACLLVFRRTATLGGLILTAVMANVVMLNFAYDVPVKISSFRYLLMAGFIVAPDIGRLFDVLVRNRSTQPRPVERLFRRPTRDRIMSAVGVVYILYIVWFNVGDAVVSRWTGERFAKRQPLYGIYEAEEFTKDGVTLAPALSETERWRWFVFRDGNRVTIRTMSDVVDRFTAKLEATSNSLKLTDAGARFSLNVEQLDSDHILISGEAKGASIVVRLRRIDETKSLLLSRGFHWIQEQPFNR